jgi:TrmH family RNA methyltransferase
MRKASKNEIKLLRKLNRKKYREKEQRFVVEGERAVEQVIENGLLDVETIFVVEGKSVNDQLSVQSVWVESDVFDEVADTDNPQGILAICKMPGEMEVETLAIKSGLVVATDAIQDPGNMGTILRTAAWFGAKALIAGKGSVDVYHPKVVRSTAGATGSLPVLTGDLKSIFETLEASGWEVVLLDGNEKAIPLSSVQPKNKTVMVVGNEGNGVSERLLNSGRKTLKIESAPGQEKVESLNAAVAVSIALFQLSVSRKQ